MEAAVKSIKRRSIRLNWPRILNTGFVKAVSSFLFGFLASLPTPLFGSPPFGAAAVAAVPQNYVIFAYGGAFVSYVGFSLTASAAPISALTAIMLFRIFFKKAYSSAADSIIMPLLVFLSLVITGILCNNIIFSDLAGSFVWIAYSLIAGGASVAFGKSIKLYGRSLTELSPSILPWLCASVFLLITPTVSINILGMNLLAVSVMVFAMAAGIKLNTVESLAVSAFFGILWSVGSMSLMPIIIIPVCVYLSRFILPLGRFPYIAGFIMLKFMSNLIFTPISTLIPGMTEVLTAALIIALLPTRYLNRRRLLEKAPVSETAAPVSEKLKETAGLFKYLSNSISGVSEAIGREFAVSPEGCVKHIRESLCNGCELSMFCCGVKGEEIASEIYSFASDVSRGQDGEDRSFMPRCAHRTEMQNRIRGYMRQKGPSTEELKLHEIRELSTDSYSIVSDALTEISDELSRIEATPTDTGNGARKLETGIACHRNENELHSGDNHECFYFDRNLCIIISDGMGSGKLASLDSNMTCGLIKRFLMSGFSFSTALKLVNTALKLRGGDEAFATVDIGLIDTETGLLKMAKAGAAASYILSGEHIRRLSAPGFPVGILKDIRYNELGAKLKNGDCLIMLSDGALNNGDEWLETASFSDMTPDEICAKIIRIAKAGYGDSPSDDITAVCVRFTK